MLTKAALLTRLRTAELEMASVYPIDMLLECGYCKVKIEFIENAKIPHASSCIFHGIRDDGA